MRGLRTVRPTSEAPPGMSDLVSHLERGGILAYPTETVYGLGGAVSENVAERVRRLKGRRHGEPFLLLVPDAEAVRLRWTPAARDLADAFWPGPLTLVLSDPEGRFPSAVRNPAGGVAVRVSPHPFVRALLAEWSRPLISTSANRSGEAPARDAPSVERILEARLNGEEVWVVEWDPLPPSDPSTVLDCTSSEPRILREGAVSASALQRVVPGVRPRT